MLGRYVKNKMADKEYEIISAERSFFDLNKPDQLYKYIIQTSPDIILHLAAETEVDLCEREPQLALTRNYRSTEAIAKASSEIGAYMVYVSTSNVYGHEGRLSYNELDVPFPINYYGKSKLLGEEAIKYNLPDNYLIIRAGWMIGGGVDFDHKFVGKIIAQIKQGAESLQAVDDKIGSITPANKLAEFICWAVKDGLGGTLHFACEGAVTRYDIARFIVKSLGLNVSVLPVQSSKFPLSAPRPNSEYLECLGLKSLNDSPKPLFWESELEEYIKNFF